MKDHKRNQSGFTLLELMVTLVLATMIVGLATTLYSKASESSQLKTTARNISACLNAARNSAITKNHATAFTISLVKKTYGYDGIDKVFSIHPKLALKVTSASFVDVPTGLSQIRFGPDGSSSGGKVHLSNGKQQLVIKVDWLTGKVFIDAHS